MQSKVSMVMPCYNKVKYIADMFDSILAQEWDNIELILVNDGSTDGTRDIIAAYEPRFRQRGYDVLIIDQANAGVCAAAKTGLERITGDYVCMVDADDELDPEYVSTMADWLDRHREDDFTACGYQSYTIQDDNKIFNLYYSRPLSERRNDRINLRYYLLANIRMTVWIYMVRVSYFRKCRVVENYYTATRGTHEPGYIIPILAGGGKGKYIDLPLYHFNILEESHSNTKQYSKFVEHWNEYERLVNIGLEHFPPVEKKQLQRCFMLTKYHRQIAEYSGDSAELFDKVVSEATRYLNDLNITRFSIDAATVRVYYTEIFKRARAQLLRRVVGYGAKGMDAEEYVLRFMGTKYEPTELWDVNASDGETSILGLPLYKPDFGCLGKKDMVVALAKKAEVVDEIRASLSCYKEPVKVLFADELGFSGMKSVNMQKKVSMVVPCYNKEEYIDEMLQSVYDQDYDNIELILVNDGSTDGTRERIAEWEPKLQLRDFDVIIIDQENQGVGAAVKRGLMQISGDYVCFPDCDDKLKTNYVSRMAYILDNDQTIDWVQCNMPISITNDNVKRDNYLLLLLERGIWSICRKLIRSSYLHQCRVVENFVVDRLSQEMAINIPLALGGSFPFFINEDLYYYKKRKDSIMEVARSSDIKDFFLKYRNLTIKILESLNALDERTKLMTQIGIEKKIAAETGKSDGELRNLIQCYLARHTDINVSSLNWLNTPVLYFVFETILFSNNANEPESLTGRLKDAEKIIACACLGSSGAKLLPLFQLIGLDQIICWDENGGDDISSYGYTVSRPRYNELTEKDVVLILSARPDVISEISGKVNGAFVFTVDAVKQYLIWKISKIGGLV